MTGTPSNTADVPSFNPRPTLRRLPHKPGVYRFLDTAGKVLYVGKARDLRKRVSSYFRSGIPGGKTGLLVQQIAAIEVSVAGSEGEALILENRVDLLLEIDLGVRRFLLLQERKKLVGAPRKQ